jgi:hypothetical protein
VRNSRRLLLVLLGHAAALALVVLGLAATATSATIRG